VSCCLDSFIVAFLLLNVTQKSFFVLFFSQSIVLQEIILSIILNNGQKITILTTASGEIIRIHHVINLLYIS
jgi:hypothetical protein